MFFFRWMCSLWEKKREKRNLFKRKKILVDLDNFLSLIKKMALLIQEDKLLAEEVHKYPCLYDKKKKSYHERDVVRNAWEKV